MMNSATKYTYPLFESIKKKDDKIFHLDMHMARMKTSSKLLWQSELNLGALEDKLHSLSTDGLQKCKVSYSNNEFIIECRPYQKKAIHSLQIIVDDEIDYSLKYTDRTCLQKHFNGLSFNEDFIICKHGLLTDASYANIVLWNGHEWHTPKTPLFKGIQRAILLNKKEIFEHDIAIQNLRHYQQISLINAMLDLGELVLDRNCIKDPARHSLK